MSVLTSSSPGISSGGGNTFPTNPTVANVDILAANTEGSYTLPANTRSFTLYLREGGKLQVAFASGDSSTTYFTVESRNIYVQKDVDAASVTIYFQASKGSNVLEIVSWS